MNPDVPDVSHNAGIVIVSAMVNAVGDERENEWVSIGNFSSENVDFAGWKLDDTNEKRAAIGLSGILLIPD